MTDYQLGYRMLYSHGYEDGLEGFTCNTDHLPDLVGRSWKLESKAFRYGCYMGYREGWARGYRAGIKELVAEVSPRTAMGIALRLIAVANNHATGVRDDTAPFDPEVVRPVKPSFLR